MRKICSVSMRSRGTRLAKDTGNSITVKSNIASRKVQSRVRSLLGAAHISKECRSYPCEFCRGIISSRKLFTKEVESKFKSQQSPKSMQDRDLSVGECI